MKGPRSALRLAVALAMLSTAAASAAVYVPTKTADSADGACNSDCSLREALLAANARPGDDVILLHAGTYALGHGVGDDTGANGDLDVLGNLVVVGDGARVTAIDGDDIDRIFDVAPDAELELRDVSLVNGWVTGGGGGAIRAAGAVTVLRSSFSGNRGGVCDVSPCTGGGAVAVASTGSLSVRDSTFIQNIARAGGGGAIFAAGELALSNVTLVSNTAPGSFGGGIYVAASSVARIDNATLTDNAAVRGGGVFVESNAFLGSAPQVVNSILALNSGATADPDCSGPVDSGYDLIGDGAGCVGPSPANHDLVGALLAPIDPKLGPLRDNGGPTLTRALLVGSPAIDAANPAAPGSSDAACETTDQRGVARPVGSHCDIGAFELTAACVAGGEALCLNRGRFRVTASWQTAHDAGVAHTVPFTSEGGYLWFFAPDNVEVTIKVIDACTFNQRFWVFASGVTNVKVDITVTDTLTNTTKLYSNPINHPFTPILDTSAFATCP